VVYGVTAADDLGAAVSGVPITWAMSAGPGTITPTQDTTALQPSGQVSAVATVALDSIEGTVTATATAPTIPGAPQASFTTRVVTAIVTVGGGAPRRGGGGSCLTVFRPASVTVPVGRTVAWTWLPCASLQHNVTFEDGPAQPTSSPTQSLGTHFRTFAAPGVYRYRCTLHSTDFATGEVGTITVQ